MKTAQQIITKAFAFAYEKHGATGALYSGKPFIYHPCQVAEIIRKLRPEDTNLIAAAYLHDVLEDTDTSYEELEREFNEDIATLVDEVTKTAPNTFANLKSQRAITLKLADRAANFSNVDKLPTERQKAYMQKVFWKS